MAEMRTKTCGNCNIEKVFDEFYKRPGGMGVRSHCKTCMLEKKKEYRVLNLDKINIQNKKYRETNREKRKNYYIANKENISAQVKFHRLANLKEISAKRRALWAVRSEEKKTKEKEMHKKWGKANPEKVKLHYDKKNKKHRENPKYCLSGRMSLGIRRSLKGNKNRLHWETLVDYSLNDLVKHLKSTLPDNYKWEDYVARRNNFHIDHIIPVSAFNFETIDDTDFRRCWALNNLRLLPAKENLSKSSKIDRPFQPALAFGAPIRIAL